jgi:hypothetical protein
MDLVEEVALAFGCFGAGCGWCAQLGLRSVKSL